MLVVALDGYNLDASFHGDDRVEADKWNRSSKGVQVRMSLNNSARMTIAEFAEINEITLDAYRWLRDHA